MKTKYILLAVMGLLATLACNRIDQTAAVITVDARISPDTKVSSSNNAAAFETGDALSLYAWTGDKNVIPATLVVNGVKNTLGEDGKWTPETMMRWADRVSDHYFMAVSPARKVTDFKADAYTLDPADYVASDLLIATRLEGLKSKDNPVSLNFDHALAKLQVNLNFRNQWSETPKVSSVLATAAKTATVDYLTKSLTAATEKSDVSLPALSNAAEGYALSFSGLMIPQSNFKTLTIKVESDDYVFTNSTDIPLVAGKVTVLNLVIGRDKIDLGSDVTINDWTSQGDPVEGEVFKPAA